MIIDVPDGAINVLYSHYYLVVREIRRVQVEGVFQVELALGGNGVADRVGVNADLERSVGGPVLAEVLFADLQRKDGIRRA